MRWTRCSCSGWRSRWAAALGRILLVGCEPATLGPEEGQFGLSEQVEAAVDEAVTLVSNLVREIREGGPACRRAAGHRREKGDGPNECLR